jgi:ubiquinone/menaquinone biosynthesis C-methylase UbiE
VDSKIGDLSEQRKAVRRYWDKHPISTDSVSHERGTAESFDAVYSRWDRGTTPLRLEFLETCRGTRVLEVGCGIAVDGRFLAENGIDYQAIDFSMESLRLAHTHFNLKQLPPRFANADAARLPFDDGVFGVVFSIGVLHHVPDMLRACREVVRVTKPGGNVRVMFYNRHSYHYALVDLLIRPMIWLLLNLPLGSRLARLAPTKFRQMYEICRRHGFDRQRILNISTDTSSAGEDDFNPLSRFVTERELREIFRDLEDHRFWRSNLKYYPLPWLRKNVERRWGFFLAMTARKRAAG